MESFENLDLSKLNGVVFSGKDFKIVNEKNGKTVSNKRNKKSKSEPKNSLEQNALFKHFFGLASDYFEKQKDRFERNIGDRKLYIKKIRSKAENKAREVEDGVLKLKKEASILKKKIKIAKKGKNRDVKNIKEYKKCLSELEDKLLNMQEELLSLQDVSNGNLSFKPTHETGNNMDYQKFKNGMPNHGENSEKGISQNAWINERWDDIVEKNPDVIKKIGEDKDHQPGGKDNPR